MEVTCEVAIVGAGPAGSTLAALLAARGVSVAIVDRDQFPRDKLCGEFISYDALPLLDALGVMPALSGAASIRRCRVVASRPYEFELPERSLGISRMFLDDLLLRVAISRGARAFIGWSTTHLDSNAVQIERQGATQRICASVVVGAWGRWGRFDSQLGRSFVRDRSDRSFGFKRHYRNSSGPRDVIELYSFSRGYLGVNAIENCLTNICGLVHASRLDQLRGRWPAFVEAIRRERPEIDWLYSTQEPAQEGFLSSEPVIFRARAAVERNVFMIGDASGVIDPLTGNGIAMAMQSSLLAAPHLLQVLGRSGDRQEAERRYIVEHRRLFAPRIRWSRRVASLLSQPRLVDAAIAALRAPAIGRFLFDRTRASRGEIERLTASWVSC